MISTRRIECEKAELRTGLIKRSWAFKHIQRLHECRSSTIPSEFCLRKTWWKLKCEREKCIKIENSVTGKRQEIQIKLLRKFGHLKSITCPGSRLEYERGKRGEQRRERKKVAQLTHESDSKIIHNALSPIVDGKLSRSERLRKQLYWHRRCPFSPEIVYIAEHISSTTVDIKHCIFSATNEASSITAKSPDSSMLSEKFLRAVRTKKKMKGWRMEFKRLENRFRCHRAGGQRAIFGFKSNWPFNWSHASRRDINRWPYSQNVQRYHDFLSFLFTVSKSFTINYE